MSADPHYQATADAHTGPIKNPKQLLLAVFFSFIVPILIIVALVTYVVSGTHPAGTVQGDNMSLYGVSKADRDRDVAERLKRVGTVEIRDANRELVSGEVVYKAQCSACHATGAAGAPKFSDVAAWAPRIGQGYATLLEHALKGKGAMPPQGGGDYEDTEIGRAVVYMADAGGAKFPVPDRPAAAGAEGAAPAAADAPAAMPAAEAPAAAAAPAMPAAPVPAPAAAAAPAAAPAAPAAAAGAPK